MYKESICYEATGMLPGKGTRAEQLDNDLTLSADEIWPRAEDGTKKGKLIATRDTHGNIVVDPAGNIVKNQYLLDYNVYKALHLVKEKH